MMFEIIRQKIESTSSYILAGIGMSMPTWDAIIQVSHGIGAVAQAVGFIIGTMILCIKLYRDLQK